MKVKLCDFGLSKTKDCTVTQSIIVGTISWSAPECLTPYRLEERNRKADLYSFGVIFWELLTGNFPWRDEGYSPLDVSLQVVAGERLKIPGTCPNELKEIMEDCWRDGK